DEDRLSNVVIMGIGEPLLNATALIKALRTMKASWGMGIGYNRITLSTVGVLGQLPELVKQNVTPNLALSLHAPNDAIRAEIVPTMKNVKLIDIIKRAVARSAWLYQLEYVVQGGGVVIGRPGRLRAPVLRGYDVRHLLANPKDCDGAHVALLQGPGNTPQSVGFSVTTSEAVEKS